MYAKGRNSVVPSDAQAQEKLALYVYEYLLHVGAEKAAQTFLTEIGWEKNITLGEPLGFLHSWWCVFWDLYCATPERRDTYEHSSEAKAFHDYGFVNSGYDVSGLAQNSGPTPSSIGQIPLNSSTPRGPIPPGFFPNLMRPSPPTHLLNQSSPHSQPPPSPSQMMSSQAFMGPRYPLGPPPGLRIPLQMGNDFSRPPGQPISSNNTDFARQVPPGMNSSRGPPMGPLGHNAQLRGPITSMPMTGPAGRPQWQPKTLMCDLKPMNYSPSSSPGNYGGISDSAGPPGTLIMPSPQDSSNSGCENMYTLMKLSIAGNVPGEFPMDCGPEGGTMEQAGSNSIGPVLNSDRIDGIKSSPASGGPEIPREDSGSRMGDYNLTGFDGQRENNQMESAAILKIKESMQEEAKRFEKDSDHSKYFM